MGSSRGRAGCVAALAAATVLLPACAGWKRDLVARTSSVIEPLVVRCDAPPAPGAALRVASVTVEGELHPKAKVGSQFDWGRPFEEDPNLPDWLRLERKPLVVDADAFGRTLREDAQRLLAASGGEPPAGAHLFLRFEDVRTVAIPGRWNELRGRVLARVAFRAALRDAAGGRLWSGVFEGEAEDRVIYFRQVHHERMLSEAYCRALTRFGESLPVAARALAPARAPAGAP
ncbi:hypothetical protein [Anaeromyxobacter sp. Fw109-5]|uniref:hypothetical protein n=1 Tax=Anaeromyxobacter sp. (strain Fw109-5) TaxID=404589 RepID=UPI0000ED7ADE|nr:hypothetical protein [Anaeromyxobacter sp. Fw109-5]ABS24258.1 hypothetical protein Anae109_0038 [Anaeromyxobacter sp. Fw109-5]